jgi:glycosyltransferase involved in cell wall biosynthesis
MTRLIYISLARFPTEKAHGLQIAQNCEAFAQAGYDVRLWVSDRRNTAEMQSIRDLHAHYGVQPNFRIERIPGLDLYGLARGNLRLERIAFYLHVLTFCMFLLMRLPFTRADVYYTRDEYVLWALSWFVPAHRLVYEAHLFSPEGRGAWLQRQVTQRAGSVIAITPYLQQALIEKRGADPNRIISAHDGIRAARFAAAITRTDARQQLGWNQDILIAGFVGRLHMLTVGKGTELLVDALANCEDIAIALVGGPDEMAQELRRRWQTHNLPVDHFLYSGQVAPDRVPLYLAAMDICVMPHPYTEQFAYYTSPLKLFEYMAAGRAIIASDLPGWSDVVQHEQTALLFPAGDSAALAACLRRLQEDSELRQRLGAAARARAFAHYTWEARAQSIRAHIASHPAWKDRA